MNITVAHIKLGKATGLDGMAPELIIFEGPKLVKGVVRLNGMESVPFRFHKGVKQGDSLSPLIVILIVSVMSV